MITASRQLEPFRSFRRRSPKPLFWWLNTQRHSDCGLSLRMLVDSFLNKVASEGGLSFTHLKWRRPLFVDDILSGTATITELRRLQSRPHWGAVTLDFDMRNQKDEAIMTMTLTNLVALRDPDAAFVFEARLMPSIENQK